MLLASTPSFWQFFLDGGPFMWVILLVSLVSITVILYKLITLRRVRILPKAVERELIRVEAWIAEGRLDDLRQWLEAHPSAASRIGLQAILGDFADREEARDSIQAQAREEVVRMETGIAVLEVVITIAPLLGLMGTVSGLVSVFGNLDVTGADERSAMAKGISEALGTTIFGLIVAVPAVIAHSYFTKQIEKLSVKLESLISRLVHVLHRSDFEYAELEQVPSPEKPLLSHSASGIQVSEDDEG